MEKQAIGAFQEFQDKFTKRIIFRNGESTVFVLNFRPGQSLPPHNHPGTAVYLLVLQGSGTITVNEEKSPVAKDDLLMLEGSEQFSFENTGNEPVSLYVVINKIPDEQYAQNL